MRKNILSFKNLNSAILFFCSIILIIAMCANNLWAATTRTVTTNATYYQTDARDIATLINNWRASGEAWYWNEDNTTKHQCGVLGSLTYDYALEQVAMQRAVEAAAAFAHIRPDGTDYYTCTYDGLRPYGECIAGGNSTAQATFVQWQENNEDYDGQGHRRCMLISSFVSVGAAHVVVNGTHYWVLEFGYDKSSTAKTTALDGTTTKSIKMDDSLTTLTASVNNSSLSMTYGATVDLPKVTLNYKINVPDSWYGYNWGSGLDFPSSDATITWASQNTNIVSISGNFLSARNLGSTTITMTAKAYGKTYTKTLNVTVSAASLSGATVTVNNQTYSGQAIEPKPVVTVNGKTLVEGTDYTCTYSNNTSAYVYETATSIFYRPSIKITGIGNYTGYKYAYFDINPVDLSKCTMTLNKNSYEYTGSVITPSISITYGDMTLASGTNYTISSPDTNAGDANFTVTGKGNFTGTLTGTFKITPCDISTAVSAVYYVNDKTYNGTSQTQTSTYIYVNGKHITEGTDYVLSYENNVNAGTATCIITGIGNYTGSINKEFDIAATYISGASIGEISNQEYTGSAIQPIPEVYYNGILLTSGVDYTLSYFNNTAVGTAWVVVNGIGNYCGSQSTSFIIYNPDSSYPVPTFTPTSEPASNPTLIPTVTPNIVPTVTPAPTNAASVSAGTEGFVERLYSLVLGRQADQQGKDYWISNIQNGMTGADVAGGFLYSPEFLDAERSNEDFVEILYNVFFDRESDAAGKQYWVNFLANGVSKMNVISGFINSTEWANVCLSYGIPSGGTGVPNIRIEPNENILAFATRLYTTCLCRTPDAQGLADWASMIANQEISGSMAAHEFFFSAEFLGDTSIDNSEYIIRLYSTFMDRLPDQAGSDYWVDSLDNGASREEVFNGFADSIEWSNICNSYGILK